MTAPRDAVRRASFSNWSLVATAHGRVQRLAPRLPRVFLVCAAMFTLVLVTRPSPAADAAPSRPIRFGTTAVILEDQVAILRSWKGYLEERLGRPVRFVHRGSYQEITELLSKDQLDFAWVCGYPYVRNRSFMRLLAIPIYEGRPLYQSYLIVPKSDTTTRSFHDLKGKIFAYSDPNSNSGFLVPQYELVRSGENPAAFFQKSFFTWAHSKVVNAVAAGLANGGAVDGYVWDTLQRTHPDLTAQTRVVRKSALYGFPPLVARAQHQREGLSCHAGGLGEHESGCSGAPTPGPAQSRRFCSRRSAPVRRYCRDPRLCPGATAGARWFGRRGEREPCSEVGGELTWERQIRV